MPPTIVVEGLTRVYPGKNKKLPPVVACDQVSFEVQSGEIFGLLGPNGAGKTSLVLQLLGLLKPTAGQVHVEGIDVVKYPDRVKSIAGFLPQTAIPMQLVEVERALFYTGCLRGLSEREAQQQLRFLLVELGLEQYARSYVNTLSGGVVRLVNFAMALMGWPKLLVLDEPTNELDPHNRRLIWEVITRLNRERGVTCILVTHNVLEAEKVIQRVAVMHRGKFVALGKPEQLKTQLGSKGRLEFSLKEEPSVEARLNEGKLNELRKLGQLEEPQPGFYRFQLCEQELVNATNFILNNFGLNRIANFKVVSPSLEDLYLGLEFE